MNEDELQQIMYGWELRVVPDPMVTPPYQRTFGSAAVPNFFPMRVLQDVSDAMARLRAGMITLNEARAQMGL